MTTIKSNTIVEKVYVPPLFQLSLHTAGDTFVSTIQLSSKPVHQHPVLFVLALRLLEEFLNLPKILVLLLLIFKLVPKLIVGVLLHKGAEGNIVDSQLLLHLFYFPSLLSLALDDELFLLGEFTIEAVAFVFRFIPQPIILLAQHLHFRSENGLVLSRPVFTDAKNTCFFCWMHFTE